MALNTVSSERLSTNVKTTNLNSGFGQLSNRNVVKNGAMQIAQRGYSFSGVSATAYHLDRFQLYIQNSSAAFAVSQNTDSPDGFGQSLKIDVSTADTSIASNEEIKLIHKLEGFDVQRFLKGSSAAKRFTLSFYVKATKTGVYCVELYDRDNNRDVSGSYTVSDTNWNRYTIDFPADTTGAFGNDNGSSLEINWWLVAGSAAQGGTLNTAWRSQADASSATGQVNFTDSTSNDWLLTGVQLEATDNGKATDFEHRSQGEQLTLCKRYFNNFGATTATGTSATYMLVAGGYARFGSANSIALQRIFYDVEMRANPTVTYGRNSTNDDNNVMRWSSAGTNPVVLLGSQEGSNQCGFNLTRYNSDAGQTYNDGDHYVHQISKFTANAEL